MREVAAIRQKQRQFPLFFLFFLSGAVIAWTLLAPEKVSHEVMRACTLFVTAVLPPLFTFSVSLRILMRLGLCEWLARSPLRRIFSFFGVSVGAGTAFAIGLFAGFPTGVLLLCELCGEEDRERVARLLPLCNNAGASFVIGAVGSSLFGSADVGLVLFLAQTAAALLSLCLFVGSDSGNTGIRAMKKYSPVGALTSAVTESASVAVAVCGYIVFFSVFSALICAVIPMPRVANALMRGVVELSGGVAALSETGLVMPVRLALCGLMLGFGGGCVFLQAADIAERSGVSVRFYFMERVVFAALCSGFTLLFFDTSDTMYAWPVRWGVFIVIFTIAGVKNKIFFQKRVEKRKGMLYNSNENPCP